MAITASCTQHTNEQWITGTTGHLERITRDLRNNTEATRIGRDGITGLLADIEAGTADLGPALRTWAKRISGRMMRARDRRP